MINAQFITKTGMPTDASSFYPLSYTCMNRTNTNVLSVPNGLLHHEISDKVSDDTSCIDDPVAEGLRPQISLLILIVLCFVQLYQMTKTYETCRFETCRFEMISLP